MAVGPRRGISGVPKEMARPAGLEPTTPRLEILGSIFSLPDASRQNYAISAC